MEIDELLSNINVYPDSDFFSVLEKLGDDFPEGGLDDLIMHLPQDLAHAISYAALNMPLESQEIEILKEIDQIITTQIGWSDLVAQDADELTFLATDPETIDALQQRCDFLNRETVVAEEDEGDEGDWEPSGEELDEAENKGFLEVLSEITTDYENLKSYFPFETCRDYQDKILDKIQEPLQDPKVKTILIEAGPGIGKSPLAVCIGKAAGTSYVMTANKGLQDQYLEDFSALMRTLKGRVNYKCYNFKDADCGNSPCRTTKKPPCEIDNPCEYQKARIAAAKSSMTTFNFAAALPFLNYVKNYFGPRNVLICDEAHSLWQWLSSFVGVSLGVRTLAKLDIISDIPDEDTVEAYVPFLKEVLEIVTEYSEDDTTPGDRLDQLLELKSKITFFQQLTNNFADFDNFLLDKTYHHKPDPSGKHPVTAIKFDPIQVAEYMQKYVYKHADKTVLLSATILDFNTYMDLMGLDPQETFIVRCDSPFDASRQPIHTKNQVGPITNRTRGTLMPVLANKVHDILKENAEVKGIIHGNSWEMCDTIYESISFRSDNRLFYSIKHDSKYQAEMIEHHKNSDRPTVLLSPSMTEGFDLKEEISRLQIVTKVPYPYLGNPLLKARMEIYPDLYPMLTAQALIQMCGRSMRSEDDWCITEVLDSKFLDFIDRNQWMFPASFLRRIQK